METKHTPGPWYVYQDLKDFNVSKDIKDMSWDICQLANWSAEENEANAHLIAAAPDLLEALIETKNALIGILKFNGLNFDTAEIDRAEKAINKALNQN